MVKYGKSLKIPWY